MVYRGDLFPQTFYGNVFVAEPSANLIRRAVLTESGLALSGRNAYEKREFLTSTYERFRPVNLHNGPDGALYVVDMHHGILQHRHYLTPYLRHKYLERQLDEFLMTGRIYRVIPAGAPRTVPVRTSDDAPAHGVGHSYRAPAGKIAQVLVPDASEPAA